jgi:hypothetical protein
LDFFKCKIYYDARIHEHQGKVKIAPSHAMEAQMGSRGIALLFLNLSPR